MTRTPVRLALAAGAISAALLLSGCSAIFGGSDSQNPFLPTTTTATAGASPTPISTCNNLGFESVFSAYGTVHYTRMLADKLTLDFDMFTQQKTHDWTPELANKQINFVIQVLDTNASVSDPFIDKRRVYLYTLELKADTVSASGANAQALDLNLEPRTTTLDPEALHKGAGVLITSPKGGYQRREITSLPAVAADTIGLNLTFHLKVQVETKKNSNKYTTSSFDITLPVGIFSAANSTKSTSCATSSTLAPVDGSTN